MTVERALKRLGREGNRWVNEQPSGGEISEWFAENVPIAEGLSDKDYVAGVTLIPNEEKAKTVIGWDGNNPIIEKVTDLVFTPYMRVETRVKYFHDLMAKKELQGFIEPVPLREPTKGMPPGFFRLVVGIENGEVRYFGCAMRVVVYEKGSLELVKMIVDKRNGEERMVRKGKVLVDAVGTKMVPTLSWGKADDNAIMKAETGAVGRALGMAGMLVIPGTGIATAEDMQELGSVPEPMMGSVAAELPAELPPEAAEGLVSASSLAPPDPDAKLREEATAIIAAMGKFPETLAEFKAWAHDRGFQRLSEVTSPALRGLVKRANDMLTTAEQAAPAKKPPAKPKAPHEAPEKQ